MHDSNSISLKKGDYTMKLLLRHPNRNLLEQMKDIPAKLTLNLPATLACDVYGHLDIASTPSVTDDNRSTLGSMQLRKGM